jgi:hypothetical protein
MTKKRDQYLVAVPISNSSSYFCAEALTNNIHKRSFPGTCDAREKVLDCKQSSKRRDKDPGGTQKEGPDKI